MSLLIEPLNKAGLELLDGQVSSGFFFVTGSWGCVSFQDFRGIRRDPKSIRALERAASRP